MKKTLITILFSLLYVSSASADFGVNVGVSGNAGIFAASGNEKTGSVTKGNDSEYGEAAWGSIFLEGTLNDRFLLGIDYVPAALESETAESTRVNTTHAVDGTATETALNNKVQLDFEDLTTVYAGFMINENLYVKAGIVRVDVITNETLGTGASYANFDLDGSMFGVGYHKSNDNGVFFRIEGNYVNFDGESKSASGTDADNTITIKSLDGLSGKISLGKTF